MNPESSSADPSSLSLDPAQAQAALREIELIVSRTRKSDRPRARRAPCSSCGDVVWAAGFSLTEFVPERSGTAWLALDLLGVVGSIVIGVLPRRPVTGGGDARIGMFWLVLFLYAGLWFWMLRPSNGIQIGAYWATVPMFGYVVGGLWLSRFFVFLGVVVTALTILGFTLFHEHFNLWMAMLGGGSLIVAGIYIRLYWK